MRIEVSGGGWAVVAALVVVAGAPLLGWGPGSVPMWGLVAALIVPVLVHEAGHLAAARLVGLRPVGLRLTGTSIAAVASSRAGGSAARTPLQQVAVSLGGPVTAMPLAALALVLTDPVVSCVWVLSCAGSLLQLVPLKGSDGQRLLDAARALNTIPASLATTEGARS